MSDTELNQLLHKEKRKQLVLFVAIAISVLLFFFLPFLGVITIVISVGLYSRSKKVIKDNIGSMIAYDVIGKYIDDLEYHQSEQFDHSLINSVYMAFPGYDRIRTNDLICGFYKNHKIRMCDLILTDRRVSTAGKGTSTHNVTVFQGPYIEMAFAKKVKEQVTVTNDKFLSDGNINMESESFNEAFNVYSQSEHDAFFVLTPQMMERIEKLNDLAGGDIHINFHPNGNIYFAINNHQNNFEIEFHHRDITMIKEDFDNQLRFIISLIDEIIEDD